MKISHHVAAIEEIVAAAEYFNEQDLGLGGRFVSAIDQAVREIAGSSLAWPQSEHGTRKRILISPFPYTIYYKSLDDRIVIIAVAHQSRQPEYWKDRIN